jgi:hypothetical protein
MYCGLIAVGLIAGIIVLARFSTYLSPKDSNESNAASCMFYFLFFIFIIKQNQSVYSQNGCPFCWSS